MARIPKAPIELTPVTRLPGAVIPNATSRVFGQLTENINRTLDRAAHERGQREGLAAQQTAAASGDGLQSRSDFTISGRAFNDAARAAFVAHKQTDAETALTDLRLKNLEDPNGPNEDTFKTAFADYRRTFLEDVPADLQPQIGQSLDRLFNRNRAAIRTEAFAVKRQQHAFDLEQRRESIAQNVLTAISEGNVDFDELDGQPGYVANNGRFVDDMIAEYGAILEQQVNARLITGAAAEKALTDFRQDIRASEYWRFFNKDATNEQRQELITALETGDSKLYTKLGVDRNELAGELLNDIQRRQLASQMRTRLNQMSATDKAKTKVLKFRVGQYIDTLERNDDIDITKDQLTALAVATSDPVLAIRVDEAYRVRAAVSNFASSTDDQQEATLTTLRNKDQLSPIESVALDRLRDVRADFEKARNSGDMIGFAKKYKTVDFPAFDINNPQTFQGQIDAATQVSEMYGTDLELISKDQVAEITADYERSDTQKKLAMTVNLANFLGTNSNGYNQVMKEIANTKPELTTAVYLQRIAQLPNNPLGRLANETATMVVQGGDLLKRNPEFLDSRNEVKEMILTQVNTLFPGTSVGSTDPLGKNRESLVRAALAIYAVSVASEDKIGQVADETLVKEAVGRLFGLNSSNDLAEINDTHIPPFEFGMGRLHVQDRWTSNTEESFKASGDGQMPVLRYGLVDKELSAKEIIDEAIPVQVSPGVYALMMKRDNNKTFLTNPATGKTYFYTWGQVKTIVETTMNRTRKELPQSPFESEGEQSAVLN